MTPEVQDSILTHPDLGGTYQSPHEVLGAVRGLHVGGEVEAGLVIHNLPVSFHQGLRIEWSFSVEHLIHADPQAPPVTLGPVTTLAVLHGPQDLRGDVVWRPHCHVALHGP